MRRRRRATRREAFGVGLYLSLGVMSGVFLSALLAAAGVLAAWNYLGFWPL
jgi:hypothetical protein